MKKIIGFAGSNSSNSINKALVTYAIQQLPNCDVEILDLNQFEAPLYSIDREKNQGIPQEAFNFLEKLKSADALVVSLAENNRTYSTAFKNIFDWISRIEKKPFGDKPTLLMSTSPGGYGGGNVMAEGKKFLPEFGMSIVSTFSLPKFNETFERGSGVIDPMYKNELMDAINAFQATLE